MKPWDSLRREVSGAWRSVRYDLDHRSKAGVESKSTIGPTVGVRGRADDTDPDATVILAAQQPERESIWAPLRNPRRLMATMVVASGVAASATGTFFAVTGGLGILLVDSHDPATAPPTVPANAPQVVVSATPHHRQTSAAPNRPSPSASVTASPSASASVRVSPTPSRSADPVKPSPSATAVTPAPSSSTTPNSTPSATESHSQSPTATPLAPTTP